jgi:methyl-accepting chemotaxis protein
VADIMSEISAASQEQSMGIEQLNAAIGQRDEMTVQNAALVEQAAAAAQSMQDEAQVLSRAVAVFTLHAAPAPVVRLKAVPKPAARAATPRPRAAAASSDWEAF